MFQCDVESMNANIDEGLETVPAPSHPHSSRYPTILHALKSSSYFDRSHCQPNTHAPLAYFGHHPLESGTRHTPGGGSTQVLIHHFDRMPAQLTMTAPPSHTAASDSPGYGLPGRATTDEHKEWPYAPDVVGESAQALIRRNDQHVGQPTRLQPSAQFAVAAIDLIRRDSFAYPVASASRYPLGLAFCGKGSMSRAPRIRS